MGLSEMLWYAGAVYMSVWLYKMIIVTNDLRYLTQARIAAGKVEVPDNWTPIGYSRLVFLMYLIGASLALLVLLVPTILREGLGFFRIYSRKSLACFAISEEWEDK